MIDLSSGRLCTVEVRLGPDVPKRRVVELHRPDGTGYTWCDERVDAFADPGHDLLGPQPDNALRRELAAFRHAIAGTGPRMAEDSCLSIGIAELLDDVSREVEVLA